MKTVLLVGSCRPPRSNSAAIASFLESALTRLGGTVTTLGVHPWRDGDAALPGEALAALRDCDAVVLVAPVYLDWIPAPALRLMAAILDSRDALSGRRSACYAVVHSGYLEPANRAVGLETCSHFAKAMGFSWQGGLGFGGTSPIGGAPLADLGWMTKHLRASLELLVPAIHALQPVPEGAVALSRKSPIPLPLWLLVPLLNRMTRKDLRGKGVADPLARPYDQAAPVQSSAR